jgi:cytochrome b561
MNDGTYRRPARFVHWLTALLLAALFGLGISMTRWVGDDSKIRVYSWHEWVGITVFGITAFRLWWRLRHPAPPYDLPPFERAAAAIVYVAMYVLLFAQPIVGWLMSTAFGFPVVYLGLIPLPAPVPVDQALAEQLQQVHFALAMGLLALFVAHLGGVLYHHLILQDGTLRRMLPQAGEPRTPGPLRSD